MTFAQTVPRPAQENDGSPSIRGEIQPAGWACSSPIDRRRAGTTTRCARCNQGPTERGAARTLPPPSRTSTLQLTSTSASHDPFSPNHPLSGAPLP